MFNKIFNDIKNIKMLNKKKQIVYIIVFILIIILLFSIVVFASNGNKSISNKNVKLQGGLNGLIGKTQEEATEILKNAELNVKIVEDRKFSDTIPQGCVIEYGGENPRGEPHYRYETMTDLEISAVKSSLKGTGISPDTVLMEKVYDKVKVSDSDLIKGDTVELTISKGKPIKVPNLIGKTQEQSQKILEELELKCIVETESDYNSPENIVMMQSENENAIVEKGTEITITTTAPNEALFIIDIPTMVEKTDKSMNLLVKLNEKEIIKKVIKYADEVRENVECPDKFTITVYIDNVLKATKQVDLTKLTSSNTPILITNDNNFNSSAITNISNLSNGNIDSTNNSNISNNTNISNGTYNKILNEEDKELSTQYGDIYLVIDNNTITIFDSTLEFWAEGIYHIENNKILGNYNKAKYYSYEKLELVEKQINDKFEFIVLENNKLQDTIGYGLFLNKCIQQNAVYELTNN